MVKPALVLAALLLVGISPARANVRIEVDKNHQRMSVLVDGSLRYSFVVSTGRASFGTPNGTYHPVRMERSWFSKEYYNSPMPHSIFFHGGYAIHGSYEISRLGGPASHGCIRLHPSNAAALFALVKQEGMGHTTITVSGHNPPESAPRAVEQEGGYGDQGAGMGASPGYGAPTYAPSTYWQRPSFQNYRPYQGF
jgi:hypothetical protein